VVCRPGEVFFNKRFIGLLCYWSSRMPLSLLAGRGGEEKSKLAEVFCGVGRGWGVRDTAVVWSSSSVAQDWQPTFDPGGQQL
jgi:hypothetical protein